MRAKSLIAILLITLVAIPALAQDAPPWEVRPYLSTYTDDGRQVDPPTAGARASTETYTWNFTSVRHRYVCPYCGYSTDMPDPTPGDPYICPNPWDLANHDPGDSEEREFSEATPRQRVLGELAVAADDSDGSNLEDAYDDNDYPLVGRPFHPGGVGTPRIIVGGTDEFGWNNDPSPWETPDPGNNEEFAPEDAGSYMTLRAANLGVDPGGGALVDGDGTAGNSDGLRFLVVEPGSVRPSAKTTYFDAGGNEVTTPVFFRNNVAVGAGLATADQYTIHANPYRVSDGDVFYIWHHQASTPGTGTTDLEVEVYSTLHGKDFDSDPDDTDDGADPLGNLTGADLNAFDTAGGMVIITDSGALRVEIPTQFAPAGAGEGWWLLRVEIQSNTTILPRHQAVNYDNVDGTDIYGGGLEEPSFAGSISGTSTADFPDWKESFVYADASVEPVTIATADANDGEDYPVFIKDANGGFTTPEIWPYRMPPEAAGAGRVVLQWSDAAAETDLTWGSTTLPGGREVYYNTGREWCYMVDPSNPDERLIDNEDTAQQNVLPPDAIFIDSRFMCSRLDVDHDVASAHFLGDDIWMDSLQNDRGYAASDAEAATGGYAHLVLGTEQDPANTPDAWGGEYAPGTRTPSRRFTLANRLPVRALQCPVNNEGCGARYQVGEPFPDGNDGLLGPGDLCPACRTAQLVASRSEADVLYDGHESLTAQVNEPTGAVERHMLADAVRFGPSGSMVPISAPDFTQEAFADIPAYQPPSVPASSADAYFSNDIENDQGYRGTMLSVNRTDDDDRYGRNTDWDAYFLSPATGRKWSTPEALDATAAHAQWVCNVCGSPWSRDLNNNDPCPYCGDPLTTADDLPSPHVPYDTLVAEEYDPFGVQVSVQREAGLAADERVVDLGWVAPGTSGPDQWPSDVSERSRMPVRNEGNILTEAGMRASRMLETSVDGSVRSYARIAQTVPITLQTLFRYRPGPSGFGGSDWELLRQDPTGPAGELATALLQAGVRGAAGEPYAGVLKPVPLGQPLGNYGTEVLLFVDLNENPADRGYLEFYSPVYGDTSTEFHEFNPDVDEPYEPVASFATRARVVESRMPRSDFYSQDLTPTMLHDPNLENLQALWVGQRPAPTNAGQPAPAGTTSNDVPAPTTPLNVLYANAALNNTAPAVDDPLYRGWLWDSPEALALSATTAANHDNTSPASYLDSGTGDRWAFWHRTMTQQTGVSSQLRFDRSGNSDWDGSGPTEYIFGSTGARGGLTGFVREGTTNHWQFWQAGAQDREHLRYRWEWDPASGTVPSTERLMVSNSSTEQRYDFFEVGDIRYRKPALNPFTFARQPSAWGETVQDPATGQDQFVMDVVFTGNIRSLGNSDICWSRFNFGDPGDADFPFNTATDNFGKAPFPRVAGPLYDPPHPARDARGMPAIRDAAGEIQGYAGDQLEPSPRRQSYQARDIDWLVTYDYQTAPDWQTWLADGNPVASYEDPMFYVGVVTDDGTGSRQFLYAVEWTRGSYNPSSGLYSVLPRLVRMTDAGLEELHDGPTAGGPHVWHPRDDSAGESVYWRTVGGVNAKALLSPAARSEALDLASWDDPAAAQAFPAVTLTINPASGMVQWSNPLFNPDNPWDTNAVFNANNTANIVDVVMYADYTPFIRRVTTDHADDDSPSAFWNQGDSGRYTFFWRRSYGDTDTPHFGRPSFMHRSYTRAIQVGRPEIASVSLVRDISAGEDLAAGDTYEVHAPESGIITIEPLPATSLSRIGHRIRVDYQDVNGNPQVEYHRPVGWSLETPVPVNTVTSEGPVRVVAEVYEVDTGGLTPFDTVRYWLTWSSPRGVYDTRAEPNGGQRVHQSSDIYVAVVAPEHSSLIADLEVPRLEP